VRHLRSFDESSFLFIDDNLTRTRLRDSLFKAIAPLRRSGDAGSVEIADDPELLEWMRRSGCVGVFVGLESFSDAALCSQNQRIRSPEQLREAGRHAAIARMVWRPA